MLPWPRVEWGDLVPPELEPLAGTAAGLALGICCCASCLREGRHDDWCSVHLADHEALEVPPCDCGLREGVRRTPELKPVRLCSCSSNEDV